MTGARSAAGSTVLTGRTVPDPDRRDTAVADAAGVQTLLRCWVRETGLAVPTYQADRADRAELRIGLPATGVELRVAVRYTSPCGWHRFGGVRLAGQGEQTPDVDAGLLAALLVREITARDGIEPHAAADALGRLVDSVRRTAVHVQARRAAATVGTTPFLATEPFLAAEQSLTFGHPFHPASKSRQEASAAELADYSPELGGRFQLHWFAAHPSVARVVGQLPGGPDVRTALRALAPDAEVPDGYVPVPAHPWQAREVRRRGEVAALLADGRLLDAGAAGAPWAPTSSLRTVWRADAAVMLKLSLGMRVTNSRRENLRAELDLGVQVARWADAELGAWLAARYPAFGLVTDPAWVGVDVDETGVADSGLECSLRTVPFGQHDRVVCVAALVDEHVGDGGEATAGAGGVEAPPRSQLVDLVDSLARRSGAARADVAEQWFERYLDVVAEPVLGLYTERGVGVEAHHQNTLVTLDDEGWPVGGWYRDSQGYYLAASRAAAVRVLVPGFGDGVAAVFDDQLVEKRIVYYLVVNNVLGLVGALGAGGVVDETRLLFALRRRLARLAALPRRRDRPALLAQLLDDPVLPCKANLLTCVDGRDELVGPVASQSVYVSVPNPLVEVQP